MAGCLKPRRYKRIIFHARYNSPWKVLLGSRLTDDKVDQQLTKPTLFSVSGEEWKIICE